MEQERDEASYRLLENVLVPMRDGVRLAARVFLPAGAGPFPAVVALMPYHKDGAYSVGYLDAVNRALAGRGYAMVAADLRGVGNSEGIAPDAFAPGERLDGYDLVEWSARQPWSTGAVGMWGLSYGGITALSTAGARPPSLKAIVAIHAATDLSGDYLAAKGCRVAFSPDVHWGMRMAANNLLPPLYDEPDVGADELWRERLRHYRPWIVGWHERSRADDIWRQSATRPEQIEAATFLVGGWRDIFADVNFRVYEQLTAPKRLLVGPWKHVFPDLSPTAPIGLVPELARWWDRWLKGMANGIDGEPTITHYLYGADEWRHERHWPPRHGSRTLFAMTSRRSLVPHPDAAADAGGPISYAYDPLVGADSIAMHWLPGPDLPRYPPSDAAVSVCFDSPALVEPIEIVGAPVVELRVAATIAEPPLVARLYRIDPDGVPHLITLGWVRDGGGNRESAAERSTAGVVHRVRLPLRPIGYRVAAGDRLRLAVSCADLSRIWPEPRPFRLEIHPSQLELPVVAGRDPALPVPSLSAPELTPSARVATRKSELHLRRDLIRPVVRLETAVAHSYQLDDGATLDTDLTGVLTVDGERPWRSSLRARAAYTLRRPSGTVRTEARMLETAGDLTVAARVRVDGAVVYEKRWTLPVGGSDDGDPRPTPERRPAHPTGSQPSAASQTRR